MTRLVRRAFHKQMALTAFLDIEGAFNNVTAEAIREGLASVNIRSSLKQAY